MQTDERKRQDKDLADRDNGFEARLANRALGSNETTAWQRGWVEAERSLIEERYDRKHRKKA